MNMTARAQKLGLNSPRIHKKLTPTKSTRIAKARARAIHARALDANGPFVALATVNDGMHESSDGKLPSRGGGSSGAPVTLADAAQVEVQSDVQLRTERLAMHRKAVSMIAGMWKDRENGPEDGVEYQNTMRDAW